MASHWLFKSEPDTYNFNQLLREKTTNWNDVRNFQARNYLRQASVGDLVLIYHSGDEKSVVGIARVIREAYPDLDPETPGEWVQVDLAAVEPLARPVSLAEIKATSALADLLLIRQSRLSCMPITSKHFETLVHLASSAPVAPVRTQAKGPGQRQGKGKAKTASKPKSKENPRPVKESRA